jgi:Skp family chaperone for outer membrane proteins
MSLIRSFVMASLLLLHAQFAWAQDKPIGDKWAVVIGISKFANPKLNLHYTANDAHDFYQYLITEGGFAPDHVVLLQDEQATRENILNAVGGRWLPRCALPDDLVVIMLSTHGSTPDPSIEGVNYIVAHDTDIENIYGTGIAMQDIMRMIKGKVHSERIVMLVDACHSGTIDPGAKQLFRSETSINADQILQGCGQIAICSSTPGEVSWESGRYPNSVFVRQLIDGLRSKGKTTTIDDAYSYVKDHVLQEVVQDRAVTQTPVFKSKWEGSKLVLAAKPSQPHTAIAWMPSMSTQARSIAPLPSSTVTSRTAGVVPESMQNRIGYFNMEYIKKNYPAWQHAENDAIAAEKSLVQEIAASNKQLADANAQHKSSEEIGVMAAEMRARVSSLQNQLVTEVKRKRQVAQDSIGKAVAASAGEQGLDIVLEGQSVYQGGQQLLQNGVDITSALCSSLGIAPPPHATTVTQATPISVRLGYFNLERVKTALPQTTDSEKFRTEAELALQRMVAEGNNRLVEAKKRGKSQSELQAMAREIQATLNQAQKEAIAAVNASSTGGKSVVANAVNKAAQSAGTTLTVSGDGVYFGGDRFAKSGVDLTERVISSATAP